MNTKQESRQVGIRSRRISFVLMLAASLAVLEAFAQGIQNEPPSTQSGNANPLPAAVGNVTSLAAKVRPIETPPDSEVIQARNVWRDPVWSSKTLPSYAKLNDTIIIDVQDLDEWLKTVKAENKIKDQTIADLVPFFDGIALWGVHPENPGAVSDPNLMAPHKVHHLRFTLNRFPVDESRNAWSRLLNQPIRNRRLRVSIGFENGVEMPTWVDTTSTQGAYQFFLTIIPMWPSAMGGFIIGGALILFLSLAFRTDIVRDTTAPLRPDGRSPFSLGRVQMAWWFFLIIAAFFTLWVITRDTDTINASALTLMGISAGTALGSAIIDAGKSGNRELDRYVPLVDLNTNRPQIIAQLKKNLEEEESTLSEFRKARVAILAADQQAIAANDDLQIACKKRQALLKRQLEFFSWAPWKVVMYDLLADDNSINFHRFQIFVWTIVLGMIFVYKVYDELSMPDFSATLLGLLGISAGTYLGFKLPDKAPQATT